jgi:ABC-type lipoprotein release transport system permease subunit
MAGGDVRIVMQDPAVAGTPYTGPFQAIFAKMPGVEVVTPIFRSQISLKTSQTDYFADLLGLDPSSFGSVAGLRSDYSSQSLATLLAGMRAHVQGKDAGDRQHPLWTLVSSTFASTMDLHVGDRFSMAPNETPEGGAYGIVGAIVSYFPTMYNDTTAGFVVVDESDYFAALNNPNVRGGEYVALNGPSEFWLHTNGNAADTAARVRLLRNPADFVQDVIDRRALAAQLLANPLTAGMAGLLFAGAAIAALLAILGSLIQSAVAARQRLTQFAILRTLGTSGSQLIRLLVNQQLIVYLFGLVGGLALGVILATATLPFLQFSSSLVDPATLGVPPYVLAFQPRALLTFGAALALAFAAALALGALLATRAGLGTSLRLGEN